MEISVIIPVFNGEKYLQRCVDSILAQSFTDFEVFLVNDGSTDGSGALCDAYARRDARVHVLHKEKSEGAGPARNSGLDAASGRFILFLDADDHIEKNMFELLLHTQRTHNCDLVICSYDNFVDGVEGYTDCERYAPESLTDQAAVRDFFIAHFPQGRVGYLWNKLYKADIIRENRLRFPAMRRLQDGVFNIGYFGCIHSCAIIEQPLYHYMLNPQTGLYKKCPKDYFELIKRFSTDFLRTVEEWGYSPAACDQNITAFFLNELGNCLENACSENWGMDKTERNAYFAALRADSFVRQQAAKPILLGRYRRVMLRLLMHGHFGLLRAVIGVKTGLKMRFKALFYALKGGQKQ